MMIDLLLALSLGVVILGLAGMVFRGTYRVWSLTAERTAARREAVLVSAILTRKIRSARRVECAGDRLHVTTYRGQEVVFQYDPSTERLLRKKSGTVNVMGEGLGAGAPGLGRPFRCWEGGVVEIDILATRGKSSFRLVTAVGARGNSGPCEQTAAGRDMSWCLSSW